VLWGETRACPVKGCCERKLKMVYDGMYEYVRCPEHGGQYPIPDVGVPEMLMPQFLEYMGRQPRGSGVHRKMVYTQSHWRAAAHQFMRQFQTPPFETALW